MRFREHVVKGLGLLSLCLALTGYPAAQPAAQKKAEACNMELLGYNDLQGRAAYMATIKHQGDRWIAYVGSLDHFPSQLNPLTGQVEGNGTSIVDVTDPRHPKYITHIPGGEAKPESSGPPYPATSQFTRVCGGSELPHGVTGKFYLLRPEGVESWEIWDVTDPAKPSRLTVIAGGSVVEHQPWWECDTGIAYLPSGPLGWRVPAQANDVFDTKDHAMIYDLSDPAKPVFIRAFGLPEQVPGSTLPETYAGLHSVISAGPKDNRVFLAYGNGGPGVVTIVDRAKLLNGPKEPTEQNERYPVIARIDLPPDTGAHTAFPLLQMHLPEFAKDKTGSVKDFVAITGNSHNVRDCAFSRQMVHIFDITPETKPVDIITGTSPSDTAPETVPMGVSTWTVPEASGNFCSIGGIFGTHGTNNNFTPIYLNHVLFVAFHNAGVRALDVRDPYNPKEIGYYIPAVSATSKQSCIRDQETPACATVSDVNNIEVDDRGYIYTVDGYGGGLHILQLTGEARQVADFARATQ